MLKHLSRTLMFTAAIGVGGSAAMAASDAQQMSEIPAECGKQWTIADQNNDGEVTFEEGKAFADTEFGRLDTDKDGKVSQAEFDRCNSLTLSAKINPEKNADAGESASEDGSSMKTYNGQKVVNGMVMVDATVDENNDKVLTPEEAAASYDKAKAEGKDDVTSREEQARYAGSWFAAHDVNNDGKVTMKESTMDPQDNPYTAVFEDMDANNDGNITPAEWASHYQKVVESAQASSKSSADSGGKPVETIWYFYIL